MLDKLSVEFGKPRHGWMKVTVKIGASFFEIDASDVPCDSVRELIGALSFMLKGGAEALVPWNEEPRETEFRFIRHGEEIAMMVTQYPVSRRMSNAGIKVMEKCGSPRQILLPFWRGLQRLQASVTRTEYEADWGHRFPEAKIKEVAALIERAKGM